MTEVLQERVPMSGRLDPVVGIAYGLKMSGFTSVRNRFYPPPLVEKALPMYEGCACYVNHAPPDGSKKRTVEEKIGTWHNVRMTEDGLYGDLWYNVAGKWARFIEAEVAHPTGFSFSHDTRGESRRDPRTGRDVVTRIDRVLSVDLVHKGATTTTFFESYDDNEIIPLAIRISRFTRNDRGPLSYAAVLAEDTPAVFDRPAPYVPPVTAPLVARLRRFTR